MFRLLIADDEDLVRRGLTALIEREAPTIDIVGTAVDGLEALDMARQTRPDIILTDIRMPGLNGLDVIAQLRALLPQVQCIVLSGYDEFEYARRAIGLGVADYLLKPIDPDDLLALLARLQDRITQGRQDAQERIAAARTAAETRMLRRLHGDVVEDDDAAMDEDNHAHAVLLVQSSARVTTDRLLAVCQASCPEAIVIDNAAGYIAVVSVLLSPDVHVVAALAESLTQHLTAHDIVATVIAARPASTIAEITTVYQEALAIADYATLDIVDRPLLIWQHPASRVDRWPVLPLAHKDALLIAIDQGHMHEARREARALRGYIGQHCGTGTRRALWAELMLAIVHHVKNCGGRAETVVGEQQDVRSLLSSCRDDDWMEAALIAAVDRATNECVKVRQEGIPRGTIAALRIYIQHNLRGDLSITTLGRQANLHPKYLSTLFKQVTGEPLGEYVIRTRMRRAAELLAQTNVKVYAIAEQVGYADPKHFSTMFRSVNGLSPADYRDQCCQTSRASEDAREQPAPMYDGHNRGKLDRRSFIAGAAALPRAIVARNVAAAEVVSLSFWGGWTGPDGLMMQRLITMFNATHPKVQVTLTLYNWDLIFDRWQAEFDGGTPPDVVGIHATEVAEFAAAGMLRDISVEAHQNGLSIDDYYLPAWRLCQIGAGLYAVPLDVHPLSLYINTEIARAAGMDVRYPPRTRRQLLAWAARLTDPGRGRWGYAAPAGDVEGFRQWYSFLYQNGGQFMDHRDQHCLANSRAGVDAFHFMHNLIAGWRVAMPEELNADADFRAGRVAMYAQGPWVIRGLQDAGISFITVPLPLVGRQQAVWANAHALGVVNTQDTRRIDAAMQFVAWVNAHVLDWAQGGQVPAQNAARSRLPSIGIGPHLRPFVAQLPYCVFQPPLRVHTQVFAETTPTPVVRAVRSVILGLTTPEQAARLLSEQIDQLLH